MKRNLNKFAAALLFASVVITCSLTMGASPLGHGKGLAVSKAPVKGMTLSAMGGDPANPFGTIVPTIVPPFDTNYSLFNLGFVPGVQTYYGGLTFKYDDPNTLLIGGGANSAVGRIYQIAVTRDANGHIIGFSGTATLYPSAGSTVGQYNDGGVVFGPGNVLFVTRYPANQLEQSKVGSIAPDKVVDLTPLGVTGSVGSIGFVPPGFPGAGSMKIVSYSSGGWYHCDFTPDGNGTFDITSASLRANVGGPEGIAFVPPGSPVFPDNSVLIVEYGYGKVVTAPLDMNGDPIVANSQDFIQGLTQAEGACIDPLTGDFLFSTWGQTNQVIRVSGFETPPTPTPTPTPTPGPCQFRVLIAHAEIGEPTMLEGQILAEPGVIQMDLFDASNGTPTLQQLRQYDIVFAYSGNGWNDPVAMGNVLADYEDGGGVVVVGTYAWDNQGTWNLAGRWMTGGYTPYNSTDQQFNSDNTANITEPSHPLMQGVSSLGARYRSGVTLISGATAVAMWTDGPPALAYKSNNGHTAVGINAFLGFQSSYSGEWGRVVVNAGRWLLNCAGTPTPTPTPTATATPTATPTATATVSPTATPTPSVTPSPTTSPTATPTPTPTPGGCVLTAGYWKNHEQWPVNQLQLGNRTYNRQELQSILRQPPRGNSLVQLAHQEIAAKLNIANGADGSCVAQTLAGVDASIGNLVIPPVGNGYLPLTSYVRTLGLYNEGGLCAPKCDLPVPPAPSPRPTARPQPTSAPRP